MIKIRGAFGRRGASLTFLAILFGAIGWSLVTTPTKAVKLGFIFDAMPLLAWGTLWFVTAAICLISAIAKPIEPAAFALSSGLMCIWAAGYAALAFEQKLPMVYLGFVIYLAFAAFIQVISGWPEPPDD
jgi:purine-cytosine permease-like protein